MAFLYSDTKLGASFLYGDVVYTPGEIIIVPPPPDQIPEVNLPPVPPNTTAGPGDTGPSWVVLCQVCSKRIRANTAKKRWDGVIVCEEDWEPRHSLDMIRSRKPRHHQAVVPKEPTYTFTEVVCPYPRQYAMADIGTADCAAADSSGVIIPLANGGPAVANIAVTNINQAAKGPRL